LDQNEENEICVYKHHDGSSNKEKKFSFSLRSYGQHIIKIITNTPSESILINTLSLATFSIALAHRYFWDSNIYTMRGNRLMRSEEKKNKYKEDYLVSTMEIWSSRIGSLQDYRDSVQTIKMQEHSLLELEIAKEELHQSKFLFENLIIEPASAILKKKESVTIVGSAPSTKDFLASIKNSNSDIWSLNDAFFFLQDNSISSDYHFITDSRFIASKRNQLLEKPPKNVVSLDSVDLRPLETRDLRVFLLKNLGRDGFSNAPDAAFHGCTVFHVALQVAFAKKYKKINTVGIMLPPPFKYDRIDGSKTMPEYVYAHQLRNLIEAKLHLSKANIELVPFEKKSLLNFL